MKAILVSINDKGGVCCTYNVIDVKTIMGMVSYREITDKISAQKDQWHRI
jgi:hypothetical protein